MTIGMGMASQSNAFRRVSMPCVEEATDPGVMEARCKEANVPEKFRKGCKLGQEVYLTTLNLTGKIPMPFSMAGDVENVARRYCNMEPEAFARPVANRACVAAIRAAGLEYGACIGTQMAKRSLRRLRKEK